MVDMNQNEKRIYDVIKRLGAITEDSVKTADDIMKAAQLGKGSVTASLQSLAAKGYIKRIARTKSAGYYGVK